MRDIVAWLVYSIGNAVPLALAFWLTGPNVEALLFTATLLVLTNTDFSHDRWELRAPRRPVTTERGK